MLKEVEKILAAQRILGSTDAGPKATCQAYEAIGKPRETYKINLEHLFLSFAQRRRAFLNHIVALFWIRIYLIY